MLTGVFFPVANNKINFSFKALFLKWKVSLRSIAVFELRGHSWTVSWMHIEPILGFSRHLHCKCSLFKLVLAHTELFRQAHCLI